jgi:hypothetical protein
LYTDINECKITNWIERLTNRADWEKSGKDAKGRPHWTVVPSEEEERKEENEEKKDEKEEEKDKEEEEKAEKKEKIIIIIIHNCHCR